MLPGLLTINVVGHHFATLLRSSAKQVQFECFVGPQENYGKGMKMVAADSMGGFVSICFNQRVLVFVFDGPMSCEAFAHWFQSLELSMRPWS